MLQAKMCGFWWVLAVTSGQNFYLVMWSQTASHKPKHQKPHTLFFSCQKNILSPKFAFITDTSPPQHPDSRLEWRHLVITVSSKSIAKSSYKSLEFCELLSPFYPKLLWEKIAGEQALQGIQTLFLNMTPTFIIQVGLQFCARKSMRIQGDEVRIER